MPNDVLRTASEKLYDIFNKMNLLNSLSFTLSVALEGDCIKAEDFSGAATILNDNIADVKDDIKDLIDWLEEEMAKNRAAE